MEKESQNNKKNLKNKSKNKPTKNDKNRGIEKIDEMATFCKRKGIAYPSGEIYGGLSGFYDFGPVGSELKRNIKNEYWTDFVIKRDDVFGLDGSIITNPKVWEASGHVSKFVDIILKCPKCGYSTKADSYIYEKLGIHIENMTLDQIDQLVKDNNLKCPQCNSNFSYPSYFNLMFVSNYGPKSEADENIIYLRPETAQSIFVNFKNIIDTTRVKLPFGIAQTGKAFRNEISPRNFLFRMREFEQIEIEYFVNPNKVNECPYFESIENLTLPVLTRDEQIKGTNEIRNISIKELTKRANKWQLYWLYKVFNWFDDHKIKRENLRIREHLKEELAHYAVACFDIEYHFPFGWKEIHGNADRNTYDLTQHQNISRKKLTIFDEETKENILPRVASEPSQGVERAVLAFLFEGYFNDDRSVLSLDPRFAPIKVAVFPLIKKPELVEKAKEIYASLKETNYNITFDTSGSIGKRYARQDEIGTPFDITIDFTTLEDDTVTIRSRDTKEQKRIPANKVKNIIEDLIRRKIEFNEHLENYI
ncbi:MAG: glycine--tRNA ligase [Nitrospiraceae bacterium]|nr:glycine--tRNA ligase [Nitrospiraceae bacterium]